MEPALDADVAVGDEEEMETSAVQGEEEGQEEEGSRAGRMLRMMTVMLMSTGQ